MLMCRRKRGTPAFLKPHQLHVNIWPQAEQSNQELRLVSEIIKHKGNLVRMVSGNQTLGLSVSLTLNRAQFLGYLTAVCYVAFPTMYYSVWLIKYAS